MGITRSTIEYERDILQYLNLDYKGLKWCELGNQLMINDDNVVTGSAKDVYLSLGVDHISIDINGEDGSLPIDLDLPLPFILLDQFDVITDYGTIEHVDNQYQVFKNTHDMCRKGGMMIHILPLVGTYPGHCQYYYSEEFMVGLARACGYSVISYEIIDETDIKIPKKLVATTYLKTKGKSFISENEFSTLPGIIDTGDTTHTGNYTKKSENIIRRIIRKFYHEYWNHR